MRKFQVLKGSPSLLQLSPDHFGGFPCQKGCVVFPAYFVSNPRSSYSGKYIRTALEVEKINSGFGVHSVQYFFF